MSAPVLEYGTYKNLSATGDVTTCPFGVLIGFFVNSTSTGTLVLRDGGSSGTVMCGTITPAAGQFYRFPSRFTNGLHATIANTLNVTFFYVDGQQ